MNVGFEAKRFFTNYTGLGNYSRFVVDALSKFVPENHYTLYSPKVRSHPEVDAIVNRSNVAVVKPHGAYKFFKGIWRSWGVSKEPGVDRLDVFHGLSQELPAGLAARIKKVVTVHDLIYIRFPQFYNPIDVAIYKAKVKAACRMADKVIAISNQTADDVVNFLKIDREKITIVYQGSHPIFKQIKSDKEKTLTREKYNLPDNFILTVGTLEERKNVILLIRALGVLPESEQLPIVLVGRSTPYKQQIIECAKRCNVLNKIIFLHNARFEDFPAIYQLASVFVYPSLFEGFGIPLVEAIESKIPVITSSGSCFQEAAGPASCYVDPYREDELAEAILKVLGSASLREKMIAESSFFNKRFQPPVIANDIHAVYDSIRRCD